MRMLLWDADNHFMVDEFGEIQLDSKPELGFEFNAVRYVEHRENWSIDTNSARNDLSHGQIENILQFISKTRKIYGIKVMAVDANGEWLGWVDNKDPRIDEVVTQSPPNADEWNWCDGTWIKVWYLDSDHRQTTPEHSVERVFSNSYPNHFTDVYDESSDTWVSTLSVDVHKLEGLKQVAGMTIGLITSKVSDPKAAVLDIIESMLLSAKKYLTEPEYKKLQTSVDLITDEIVNYCDTPHDVQLTASNLVLYT